MKFRHHRHLLSEAMETVVELEPTRTALVELLREKYREYGLYSEEQIVEGISPETLNVKAYCFDKRINWDTYIVHSDAMGVFGFTDGPLSEDIQDAKQEQEASGPDASSSAQ
jgi:hypothetical protein